MTTGPPAVGSPAATGTTAPATATQSPPVDSTDTSPLDERDESKTAPADKRGKLSIPFWINDVMTFNNKSKLILEKKIEPKPVEEWIKWQGRFRHLFIPKKDVKRIKTIKDHIDQMWERYRSCYL